MRPSCLVTVLFLDTPQGLAFQGNSLVLLQGAEVSTLSPRPEVHLVS